MERLFDPTLVTARRDRALLRQVAGADFLLARAAEDMAERLSAVERQFDDAVEVEGYTGLAGRLALATGRVTHLARLALERNADSERLPLAPESTGLILAPMALHLVNDLPGLFVQVRRALRPDGLFLATIPGAGTLSELRDVLLATDAEFFGGASPRVIPFADLRDIGGLLQRAGFALPVVDVDSVTVRYASLFALMADLRAMGMTNPLVNRSRRPTSRAFFLRAAELYAERHADPDGKIRASFSIVHVSGWAPHESQQKPLKPGSASARLADVLKDATAVASPDKTR